LSGLAFAARDDQKIDKAVGRSPAAPFRRSRTCVECGSGAPLTHQEKLVVPRISDIYGRSPASRANSELEYEGDNEGARIM